MFPQQPNKYLQIHPVGALEMQCFYLLQKFFFSATRRNPG